MVWFGAALTGRRGGICGGVGGHGEGILRDAEVWGGKLNGLCSYLGGDDGSIQTHHMVGATGGAGGGGGEIMMSRLKEGAWGAFQKRDAHPVPGVFSQ